MFVPNTRNKTKVLNKSLRTENHQMLAIDEYENAWNN